MRVLKQKAVDFRDKKDMDIAYNTLILREIEVLINTINLAMDDFGDINLDYLWDQLAEGYDELEKGDRMALPNQYRRVTDKMHALLKRTGKGK